MIDLPPDIAPAMAFRPSPIPRLMGWLVVAVSASVLASWTFDLPLLRNPFPGTVDMKFNAAIAFALLGIALRARAQGGGWRRLGDLVGLLVIAFGAHTLAEYLIGLDWGIDQALVTDAAPSPLTVNPGRPAPLTAINFVLVGAALLSPWKARVRQGLGLAVAVVGMLYLCAYLYGVPRLHPALMGYTGMAIVTAMVFVALGLGIIALHPDHGVMVVLLDPGGGGTLARWLLPVGVAAPLLAEGVAGLVARLGLITAEGEPVVHTMLVMGIIAWAILMAARILIRLDAERRHNAELRESALAAEASERAMRVRAELLALSNADLEQFAFVASHDLQTPLRNVVSYAQLLKRRFGGQLGQDGDEFIGFIVSNAKRMSLLINDLLDYSRLTSQSKPLHPIALDLPLGEALENLKAQIEETEAAILVDPLPMVIGEQALLVSLFQNLIGNALKYRSPERRPVVRVTAQAGEAKSWRIAVADNGIGIEPQYFDKIFQIFQRLEPRASEGTGIGLTLCRRLAHRLGGSIAVDSVPGEGSRFTVTLRDGATSSGIDPMAAVGVAV